MRGGREGRGREGAGRGRRPRGLQGPVRLGPGRGATASSAGCSCGNGSRSRGRQAGGMQGRGTRLREGARVSEGRRDGWRKGGGEVNYAWWWGADQHCRASIADQHLIPLICNEQGACVGPTTYAPASSRHGRCTRSQEWGFEWRGMDRSHGKEGLWDRSQGGGLNLHSGACRTHNGAGRPGHLCTRRGGGSQWGGHDTYLAVAFSRQFEMLKTRTVGVMVATAQHCKTTTGRLGSGWGTGNGQACLRDGAGRQHRRRATRVYTTHSPREGAFAAPAPSTGVAATAQLPPGLSSQPFQKPSPPPAASPLVVSRASPQTGPAHAAPTPHPIRLYVPCPPSQRPETKTRHSGPDNRPPSDQQLPHPTGPRPPSAHPPTRPPPPPTAAAPSRLPR